MQQRRKIDPESILELTVNLQREYAISWEEVSKLMYRERRRVEKKLSGKNGDKIISPQELLEENCRRFLDFQQSGMEQEWRADMKRADDSPEKQRAWKVVYETSFPKVAALLYKSGCTSGQQIEDIFDDAFLKLIEDFQNPDFRLDTKVSSYLTTIALFSWYKQNRRKTITVSWSEYLHSIDFAQDAGESTGEDIYFHAEFYEEPSNGYMYGYEIPDDHALTERVLFHLDNMSNKKYRIFIKVKYFLRLSHAEIAQHLQISETNSKALLKRAMDTLKSGISNDPLYFEIIAA